MQRLTCIFLLAMAATTACFGQGFRSENKNVLAVDLVKTALLRPELQYERMFRGNRGRVFSLQARAGYAIGLRPREGGKSFFIRNYLDDAYPMFITNGFIGGLGWTKYFRRKSQDPNPYGRYIGMRVGARFLKYKNAPVVVDDLRHPGSYFTNHVQDQQRKGFSMEFIMGTRQMIGKRIFMDLYITTGFGTDFVTTTITRDHNQHQIPTPTSETVQRPTGPFSIGLRLGTDW